MSSSGGWSAEQLDGDRMARWARAGVARLGSVPVTRAERHLSERALRRDAPRRSDLGPFGAIDRRARSARMTGRLVRVNGALGARGASRSRVRGSRRARVGGSEGAKGRRSEIFSVLGSISEDDLGEISESKSSIFGISEIVGNFREGETTLMKISNCVFSRERIRNCLFS